MGLFTESSVFALDEDLIPHYQDIYSRIADKVNSGSILGDLPSWICRNTFLKGRNWSFKDHEYQLAIARDQSNRKVIKKCSQVGLTELQIRLALAYLRVSNDRSLIYILPLTKLAQKISQARVETVIDGSPSLKSSLVPGSNSALYKRIGNSHFYMGGADKATEAISSPIDRMIIDERDFCRERILGIYSSRMRHVEEGSEMKDEFSTPTISNYGITAAFEESDQKHYLVKCMHCNQWQAVNFETQVVIPNCDKSLEQLEKEDFTYHRYEFDKAYIACNSCRKELDSSLIDPDRRKWVAKFPGRPISGYHVVPSDVPRYNSTKRILRQIPDYPVRQDYWNFVLGEALDTADNKVSDVTVGNCWDGQWSNDGENCAVGIDVGKWMHVTFAKKVDGRRRILAMYKVSLVEHDAFGELCDLLDRYKFNVGVMDAQPDINFPTRIMAKYGHNRFHTAYYVAGKKNEPDLYKLDEETGIVNIARTKSFNELIRKINNGAFQWPRCDEELKKEVRSHYQQMAKKKDFDKDGEQVEHWVKLSDNDHFLHSLMYANTALDIVDKDYTEYEGLSIPSLTGVSIGSSSQIEVAQKGDVARALASFGFGRR